MRVGSQQHRQRDFWFIVSEDSVSIGTTGSAFNDPVTIPKEDFDVFVEFTLKISSKKARSEMKRKTKAQREEEAKLALRQRVHDIACGAAGFQFDQDSEFATADFLERFVPALKAQFEFEEKTEQGTTSNKYLFEVRNLHHYDNIDSTTEFLFTNQVRAQ